MGGRLLLPPSVRWWGTTLPRVLASAGHGSLLGHPETLCTVRGDGSVSQLPQARSAGLTSHEARGAEPAEEAGVPETHPTGRASQATGRRGRVWAGRRLQDSVSP